MTAADKDGGRASALAAPVALAGTNVGCSPIAGGEGKGHAGQCPRKAGAGALDLRPTWKRTCRCRLRHPPGQAILAMPGSAAHLSYSTVTDLARLRGLSTSVPRAQAVW